jgi:hypothetical protein
MDVSAQTTTPEMVSAVVDTVIVIVVHHQPRPTSSSPPLFHSMMPMSDLSFSAFVATLSMGDEMRRMIGRTLT